ncbi:MAG: hypothetical protein R3B72_47745 [Polyangiaceae bacterium]
MTEDESRAIRRISRVVVALDCGAESDRSIAEACALAQRERAEVVGLFVEETGVEQAMGLGVVRMVTPAGGALRDVDPPSWRRSLRALVRLRQGQLRHAAERLHLRWSFRVEQGKLREILLRTATEVDVVVVGSVGRRQVTRDGYVVALITHAAGMARVLEVARSLSESMGAQLAVVVWDGGLEREVGPMLGAEVPLNVATGAPSLRSALRRLPTRLVVTAPSEATTERDLDELRGALVCPLVLVHGEPG